MRRRLVAIMLFFAVSATFLYINLYGISLGDKYAEAGTLQGSKILSAGSVYGNIYDCNMRKLNNTGKVIRAIVKPSATAWDALQGHVLSPENWQDIFRKGEMFVCETDTADLESTDINVFTLDCRDADSVFAIHLLGYTSEGRGVCGLEGAYDSYLREYPAINTVTYSVDGRGGVLSGVSKGVTRNESVSYGVMTTLDTEIQQICEEALGSAGFNGAAIVLDVENADIRAMASTPAYTPDTLAEALVSPNSPMLNKALSPYSLGSIFKLVVAAAALESGIEDFEYTCTGSADIGGQLFRCHSLYGHGEQDMETAMVNSCNPYFIELGQQIESEKIIEMAKAFGFGLEINLAEGISSAAGRLQTLSELSLPAEKANLCFGQGLLTATPLQVAHMTCIIAAEGISPNPRLVIGTTADGVTVNVENTQDDIYVISKSTAYALHRMMAATVQYNEDSPARPNNTTAAGKTSTAQTGKYAQDGTEYCHAWITGYFPLVEPKYCVTVFCENGGYGNRSAAPVFKKIIDEIAELKNIKEE